MSEAANAYEETLASQRAAAAPARSAFVSANAGAGKTRVLTDRVARLLLSGTPPDKILCITFTKAAAAEMADRLYGILGEWALADDSKLNKDLNALDGGAAQRDGETLASARRLFARALETPGGLKIQTIHSFCESVLRRFPMEAGAPPGFRVIEEDDARRLADAAVSAVFLDANANAALADAIREACGGRPPTDLRDDLIAAVGDRRLIEGADKTAIVAARLCERYGVTPDTDICDIVDATLADIDGTRLRALLETWREGSKNPQSRAEALAPYFTATARDARWAALLDAFLTNAGAPYASTSAYPKALLEEHPWIADFFTETATQIKTALDAQKTVGLVRQDAAFRTLLRAGAARYAAAKKARAALDFDDLIALTGDLFSAQRDMAWVMYKLDQGVDHILLDEAQDTGPDAWRIIEGPLKEFYAGAGAREGDRTFFAVGDQKQSIYSFQGADASLFAQKRFDLGKEIAAAAPFKNIDLLLSFRTVEPVLTFVDAVFADEDLRQNLAEGDVTHRPYRAGHAGHVELWPLAPGDDVDEQSIWDAPVDVITSTSREAKLTREVAETIAGWLRENDPLPSRGRSLRAGDVMILLQRRDPLYHEMIRALSKAGVPAAGPDRMQLLEDPAVLDLISYARTVLLTSDDLSLAELLKSPLFGFDDDALWAVAADRGDRTLWSALCAAAEHDPHCAEIVGAVNAARAAALRGGATAFLAHVLDGDVRGGTSGRARLLGRLGAPSREPLEELMRQSIDYENARPRSLQGFLSHVLAAQGEIKRDADEGADAVRVMTVHKAKGLEAPVVFILDGHREPNLKKLGPIYKIKDGGAEAAFYAPASDLHTAEISNARDAMKVAAYEEYRRLFYVAATRAEDRLYICGLKPGRGGHRKDLAIERRWYALAEDAFERLGERVAGVAPLWEGEIRRVSCEQTVDPKTEAAQSPGETAPFADRLRAPAPKERAALRLSPSRLADLVEFRTMESKDAPAAQERAYAPGLSEAGVDPAFRGRAIHKLLETLPGLDKAARRSGGERLIDALAPSVEPARRREWLDEALAVIEDPRFAAAFTPGSLAEAPIAGRIETPKGEASVSGVIDRLAMGEEDILVVDYKTNRPPPANPEDAPLAYLSQMAAYDALLRLIYPGKRIRSALLWTYEARLMELPPPLLAHALERTLS